MGYKFNAGSEKDDEIFIGAYTAEYWEYDSRLGRRWNVDPVVKPWESGYACMNNNPIALVDPYGLDAGGDNPEKFIPKGAPSNPEHGQEYSNSSGNFFYNGSSGLWSLMLGSAVIKAEKGAVIKAVFQFAKKLVTAVFVFAASASNAFASDNLLGYGRRDPQEFGDFSRASEVGQRFGDMLAVTTGFIESAGGYIIGSGGGLLTLTGAGAVVGVPAAAVGGALAAHGSITVVTALHNLTKVEDNADAGHNHKSKGGSSDSYKKPKKGISGKEGAKDVPSWAKGERPKQNENGHQFAERLMDAKYGKGNYSKKSQTEYDKIRKWGDRAFE